MGNHRNLCNNGGMEGAKQGADPYYPAGNWVNHNLDAGEGDVTASATHSGSVGMEFIGASLNEGIRQSNLGLNSNKYYTFSYWGKGVSGGERMKMQVTEGSGGYAVLLNLLNTLTTNWVKYSGTVKATQSDLDIYILSGANNQSFYIDDVSLIALDQAVPSAESRITEYCDGDLKDVAIFNRVLSLADIQKHYQVGVWEGLDV